MARRARPGLGERRQAALVEVGAGAAELRLPFDLGGFDRRARRLELGQVPVERDAGEGAARRSPRDTPAARASGQMSDGEPRLELPLDRPAVRRAADAAKGKASGGESAATSETQRSSAASIGR